MEDKAVDNLHSKANSIFEFLHNEKLRLRKKGIFLVVGYGIILFYFLCLPTLLYPIYEWISSLDTFILVVCIQTFIGLATNFFMNVILNHIYNAKYQFIEQFKIQNKPWPWEVDEKGYNEYY